ncbi:MAG: 2Fe-2S iron-sulfur cluster binding domain-containing protein [Hydrogenophaga sp.]|uniref:(2Fe-2S)-binding protein n=1 Tax=Hydrogenophaga sp. TaxID=1904254 RepID=UPI0016ABE8FB|nr:(2Fe-2S)-binding protein [Hydrogenophaga sp.]NIM42698.1 2Fe-2S iron-sulfur cluster binding domain-containing protein [Hydrogenophaga sp.]NIN25741.1 2Fe-2S iron-sulfur cluster binding domain-containing protein [Hydrogenophaga sp.]NIN30403.1 2Fe-2S iron-sulfur cluster binding domain-containing protein [Hydrogenophaga sp.]NIN56743.1 2Fe-2S iron-sulfur cluster binding domain-containing protein [Hydrogenophaga sp.]NIO53318.1 2Fe-2S iron-sulfur cluster binding domain-containing protein [Hydrogeno
MLLDINGKAVTVIAEPDTPLLWVLRGELGLVGTKYGCGKGLCGACMVHVNGSATRSCAVSVSGVEGQKVTTIEGLNSRESVAVKAAWQEVDVPQCGYCQSGQVMSACALLAANPQPSDADISDAMNANVCRCGTYPRIRAAIHLSAKKLWRGPHARDGT